MCEIKEIGLLKLFSIILIGFCLGGIIKLAVIDHCILSGSIKLQEEVEDVSGN